MHPEAVKAGDNAEAVARETVTVVLPQSSRPGNATPAQLFIGEHEVKGIQKLTVSFDANHMLPHVALEFDCTGGLDIRYRYVDNER